MSTVSPSGNGSIATKMDSVARARANELTLMAVMACVVMLFAAFTSAYLIRRTAADWQHVSLPGIVWINTVVLVLSSATMEMARWRSSQRWLAVTIALGVAFLVGQVLVWQALAAQGIYVPKHPHSAFIYMLTAVHGVHLLGGMIALVYAAGRRQVFGLCAKYWHFVDGVWLYLLIVLGAL